MTYHNSQNLLSDFLNFVSSVGKQSDPWHLRSSDCITFCCGVYWYLWLCRLGVKSHHFRNYSFPGFGHWSWQYIHSCTGKCLFLPQTISSNKQPLFNDECKINLVPILKHHFDDFIPISKLCSDLFPFTKPHVYFILALKLDIGLIPILKLLISLIPIAPKLLSNSFLL